MMTIMRYADEIHKRIMPDPHWYPVVLGVGPACQGQGIGSALIQPVLKRADADGVPCYLEAVTDLKSSRLPRHAMPCSWNWFSFRCEEGHRRCIQDALRGTASA
jgi:GNAT superfamily N-acetyltransferase